MQLQKKKKKRRVWWIIALVAVILIAAGILIYRASLKSSVDALLLLKNLSGRKELDMDASVQMDLGDETLQTDAHLFRTQADGKTILCIEENGVQLYYYDGAIYLENGSAYRTSGLFPDYSTLGEHLLELYNATDVTYARESGEEVYSVTAYGKDAEQALSLLTPTIADSLSAVESIDLCMHVEDGEIRSIEERGIKISPAHLKLSDKATISLPWHRVQDGLEEDRLAKKGKAFGSTRRGIAYAYSDKSRKKPLRLGDLLHLDEERIRSRLHVILDSKNMELAGCYHQEPMSYEALLNWCYAQAAQFGPYICDAGAYLQAASNAGKRIVLEAQLGAMRDIDYGIFPYTSSSNTLAAYAPLGAGIPNVRLNHVVGVLKAYSTCVGAGPFTAEKAMPEAWMERGGEVRSLYGRI